MTTPATARPASVLSAALSHGDTRPWPPGSGPREEQVRQLHLDLRGPTVSTWLCAARTAMPKGPEETATRAKLSQMHEDLGMC